MSIGRRRAPYASQLRRLVVAAHTRIATPPSISHEPVITITSHPDKCAAPATIRSAPKLSMLCAAMTSQNTGAAMTTSMRPYYADELVTLWLGDCREVTAWLDADVLVTDPPYPNNAGHFDDAVQAARDVLSSWRKPVVVFWSELERPPIPLPLVAVHVWHRTNVNGRPYEPAYQFAMDGNKKRSDVMRHPAIFDGAGPGCHDYLGHPTQKPVPIMHTLIGKCPPGTIADPFAGSGSTLVAARNLGRKAIGVELDERYAEMAARRLSQGVLTFG